MQTPFVTSPSFCRPFACFPVLVLLTLAFMAGPRATAQDAPPHKTPYHRGNSLVELKGVYWKSLTTERRRYMNGSLLLGHFVAKQLLIGLNFTVLTEKQREISAAGYEYVLNQDLIYLFGPVVRYHLNNAPASLFIETSLLRGWSKSIIKPRYTNNTRAFTNLVWTAGLTFPLSKSFKGLVSAGLVKQFGSRGLGAWPQAGLLYTFRWK